MSERAYDAVFKAADGALKIEKRSGRPDRKVYFSVLYPLRVSAMMREDAEPLSGVMKKRAYELVAFDGNVAQYVEVEE